MLVELQETASRHQSGIQELPHEGELERPSCMIIDDFLGYDEHRDMLAFALQQRDNFGAGTVASREDIARQNLAILSFGDSAHSKLICNRLLTWFPQILQTLEISPFPINHVESQLTASNDGHYYRAHRDADKQLEVSRTLTCVYYFSEQPAQFTGGELRLYDRFVQNGQWQQGKHYQQLEPINNRMVIFGSDNFHELMPIRCPSHKFEHSRFAVTNWIWQAQEPDANLRHGWGPTSLRRSVRQPCTP